MQPTIEHHRDEIKRFCRQFGVQTLELFGSATGDSFDPQRSDVDFVVDFGGCLGTPPPDLFSRYFGLNEALSTLLGRKVDLVMAGALINPHFIEAVNRTRQPIYARTLAEAA
jgi:hypothetical protein